MKWFFSDFWNESKVYRAINKCMYKLNGSFDQFLASADERAMVWRFICKQNEIVRIKMT